MRQETGGNEAPKALTSLPLLQAQQSCHSQRQSALVATKCFSRDDTLRSSLSITAHINEGGLGIKTNKQQLSGLSVASVAEGSTRVPPPSTARQSCLQRPLATWMRRDGCTGVQGRHDLIAVDAPFVCDCVDLQQQQG